MFKVFSSVALGCLLMAASVNAATLQGYISADEAWSGDITLTGDVICTSGTITIAPGTNIKFATTNGFVSAFPLLGSTASKIYMIVTGSGNISAIGTAASPITFTTASATPATGLWGHLRLAGNASSVYIFTYCNFTCGTNGIQINHATAGEVTSPVITNCTIADMSASGIYGGVSAAPTITNCLIHHITNGIYLDGAATASITNTIVHTATAGIVLNARAFANSNYTVDHCTVYDINKGAASSFHSGYGIYTNNSVTNTMTHSATITNSIVTKISAPYACLSALPITNWSRTENNNCFFPANGGEIVMSGVASNTDITTDPLLTNAATGDFTVGAGSPCIGAGTLGSTIGWLAAGTGIRDLAQAAAAGLDIRTAFNQLMVSSRDAQQISLSICDLQGRQIWSSTGSQLTWSGSQSGVYLYTIKAGAAVFQNSLVIAR